MLSFLIYSFSVGPFCISPGIHEVDWHSASAGSWISDPFYLGYFCFPFRQIFIWFWRGWRLKQTACRPRAWDSAGPNCSQTGYVAAHFGSDAVWEPSYPHLQYFETLPVWMLLPVATLPTALLSGYWRLLSPLTNDIVVILLKPKNTYRNHAKIIHNTRNKSVLIAQSWNKNLTK